MSSVGPRSLHARISFATYAAETPDCVFVLDDTGCVALANRAATTILDRTSDAMVGQHFTEIVDKASRDKAERLLRTLHLGETVRDFELNHVGDGGQVVGVTYSGAFLSGAVDGTVVPHHVLVGRPLSSTLEVVADVVEANERLRAILAVMSAGSSAESEREIGDSVTQILSEHLTVHRAVLFMRDGTDALVRLAPAGGPEDIQHLCDLLADVGLAREALHNGVVVEGPCVATVFSHDSISTIERMRPWIAVPLLGHDRPLGVLAVAARNMRGFLPEDREMLTIVGGHLALTLENFHMFQTARYLAETDPLTNVSNRRAFESRLAAEIKVAREKSQCLGLLMLDIDHFKSVNDRYGHDSGDAALQSVAATLRGTVRPTDAVARLGGEEFAVLIPNTDAEILLRIAERIRAAIAGEPVEGPRIHFDITASLGGALFPDDTHEAENLFRVADAALYESKRNGRNRITLAGTTSRQSADIDLASA